MATESEYTSGEGNSSEYEKAKYKLMRGEDLTSSEWKIIRDSTPKVDSPQTDNTNYDIGALFGTPPPKQKFVIKEALTGIREKIIDKFDDLKKDKFYDGVTLKVFMTEILQSANRNADRMKTQKQFDARIMYLVGDVMMRHKKIGGNDLDKLDAKRMRIYYGEDYQQRIK